MSAVVAVVGSADWHWLIEVEGVYLMSIELAVEPEQGQTKAQGAKLGR